ncbi:MAG TPA: AraC family transcriptional regulator [Cytophagaceae bacterium]|jgi:AraC family transcriptional activator of pobA|nr:AraC family transcriptional regulator [Cytophagaceae bacterium]
MSKKPIPIYSINQFQKAQPDNLLYEVEPFDHNRSFKVEYPHRHDNFYEILFITQGSGNYTIDLQNYPISPDHIFFVSPGQVHTIDFSKDIQGYIFLFTSDFYLFDKEGKKNKTDFPFFHRLSGHTPPLYLQEADEMIRLFEMACKEHKQPQTGTDIVIRSLLDIILVHCKRLYSLSDDETKLPKGRLLVKRFQYLIEEHIGLKWGVKEFAALLAVTPAHLNETVKEHTGITASGHIHEQIILESKRLLTHTELTVSEISEKLFFEDSSYFARYFKKYAQVSPSEFREKQL